MYESPFTVFRTEPIYRQINDEFENAVMECVWSENISVDKGELIKALQYDRGQYEKGYADGVRDTQAKFESAVAVWLKKWNGYIDDDIIARMCYRICDIARIAAHLEEEDDGNQ